VFEWRQQWRLCGTCKQSTAGIPQAAHAFGNPFYKCEPHQPCTFQKIAFFKILYIVASAQNTRINEKGTANDIIAEEL
jgi:hypothetical protein